MRKRILHLFDNFQELKQAFETHHQQSDKYNRGGKWLQHGDNIHYFRLTMNHDHLKGTKWNTIYVPQHHYGSELHKNILLPSLHEYKGKIVWK